MGISAYLLLLLTHPIEFRTLVQYKIYHEYKRDITAKNELPTSGWDRPTMRRCWEFLDLTSRSFAAVIKELEGDLARTICLFYLVLRGLDTIEDDMTIPDPEKQPLLREFHRNTVKPGWTFTGSGPEEKDRQLLVEYDNVVTELNLLPSEYREIIIDIAHKMSLGMADYAHKASSSPISLSTIEEYDLYCHYVAGLVGEGLSRLFSASRKEAEWLSRQLELSNSLGLLLQKTNIIRDFREDLEENRVFWPREIWGNPEFGFTDIGQLVGTSGEVKRNAEGVQSGMILDAMRHLTDALDYLRVLRNQSVFNFCAIPATMAIATLELCFMNPEMFRRNIKIRKAEAADLIMRSTNPREVSLIFRSYTRKIHARVRPQDPYYLKICIACARIEQWYEHTYPSFIHISGSKADGGLSQTLDPSDARTLVLKAQEEKDRQLVQRRRIQRIRSSAGAGINEKEKEKESSDVGLRTFMLYVTAAVLFVFVVCALVVWGLVYLADGMS